MVMMKRTSITIPDELEKALEDYRRDLEVPSALAAVVQAALREYLEKRGYIPVGEELVPPSGGKPSLLEDAPKIGGKKTAADAVIEDRR
jgi:Arc/MetJ-type ribon-helix-helix transcriptional regulator